MTDLIIFATWDVYNLQIFKAVLGSNSLIVFMVRVKVLFI